MNSLKGKIALMTASGQGIGFATAKAFAKLVLMSLQQISMKKL